MKFARSIIIPLVLGLAVSLTGCGQAKNESTATILVPQTKGTTPVAADPTANAGSKGATAESEAGAEYMATLERIEVIVAECNDRNRAELEQIEKDADEASDQEEINRLAQQAHRLHDQARELNAPRFKEVLTLATQHGAEPKMVDPMIWLLTRTVDPAIVDPTIALLLAHHTTDRRTLDLALRMSQSGYDWVERLLRAQLVSPDLSDERRPEVSFALASALQKTRNGAAVDPVRIDEAIGLLKDLHQSSTEATDHRGRRYVDLAERSLFDIEHLSVGKVAPKLEGADLDGVEFKLSDYHGKVVMLNFWATWCGPCMALIPHERELVAQYADRPFVLIGVNGDPDKQTVQPVLAAEKITWRSFWTGEKGPAGEIPSQWNVTAWPTIFLIDHNGVIQSRRMNDELIEELVKAAEANPTEPSP